MRERQPPRSTQGYLVTPMEAKAGRREPSPSDSREPPLICTQNLTRIFGSGETAVAAVNEVTLDVPRGEFLAITGRSGSGKTTLLNLMAGLDQPTSGSVSFDGRDLVAMAEAELVSLRRHRVGFVFQSFGLMPLLSAFENVELPLHIGGIPWRERRKRATEALEMVGLGARARHRPYELSGGEQQRVAIARALVHGPDVVFADEPTGELDSGTAASILSVLRDIATYQGVTVIVATHDLSLRAITDRAVELTDGTLQE